jgi:hypothetical protein
MSGWTVLVSHKYEILSPKQPQQKGQRHGLSGWAPAYGAQIPNFNPKFHQKNTPKQKYSESPWQIKSPKEVRSSKFYPSQMLMYKKKDISSFVEEVVILFMHTQDVYTQNQCCDNALCIYAKTLKTNLNSSNSITQFILTLLEYGACWIVKMIQFISATYLRQRS